MGLMGKAEVNMAKKAKKVRAAKTERNILADEELEWVGLGH